MHKKKVIGITGGVGSGKSVVMEYLEKEKHGAVILADLVAHDLMEPGQKSYLNILDTFGTEILKEDKTINRAALADIVFDDPQKLAKLNSITHPNVKEEIKKRIEAYSKADEYNFIAVEAALLIEGDYAEILDDMWYIYVEKDIRIKRLMDGRGYTREKSLSIMDRQLSDKVFTERCNHVINNSFDVTDTKKQVDEIIKTLLM